MAAQRNTARLNSRTLAAAACLAPASLILGIAVAAVVVIAPTRSHGQQIDTPPEIETAKHSFECQINSTTFIRSGAGENFYPTLQVYKGAMVTVVGKKGNWLKVLPPAKESFSLVQKAFVDRYGDGTAGKITKPGATVRVGSTAQPQMQFVVQGKLEAGQDVTILGEEGEFFKIKTPEDMYLYVAADAVTPVRPAGPAVKTEEKHSDAPDLAKAGGSSSQRMAEHPAGPDDDVIRTTSTTRPALLTATTSPSTRPAISESMVRLQKLETQFTSASTQPLPEQPIDALLAGYQSLASTPNIPDPTRKMADARVATLKFRAEARDSLMTFQQQQSKEQTAMQAKVAEREEIQARIAAVDIKVYAAIGTLRASNLQVASVNAAGQHTTLYRLTDPANGRTVVYVRTPDPKYVEQVGQFVGIKGTIETEPQLNLKVVIPTATDPVDPAKVNGSIAAEILPPSLEAKAPTASTGGQ